METWTNHQDLYRDLAIAQGRVPIQIEEPLLYNKQPPEKEIEGLQEYDPTSVQKIHIAPDLMCIRDMLQAVNTSDEQSSCDSRGLPITKLDTKVKKSRNCAMDSLRDTSNDINHPKKPQLVSSEPKNALRMDPTNMFRIKTKVTLKTLERPAEQTEIQAIKTYVPSANASSYYEQMLERKKQQEMSKEDIWSKAERLMKEIDERKRREAVRAATSDRLNEYQGASSPPLVDELSNRAEEILEIR